METLTMKVGDFAAFFWALSDNQFDDPDGAAARILSDEDEEE